MGTWRNPNGSNSRNQTMRSLGKRVIKQGR
jgi:hypothetical protein